MSFFYQIKFRAAWWRELKQLGYDVIPLRGKDSPYKGWPTMANGENDIEFLERQRRRGQDEGIGSVRDRSRRSCRWCARPDAGVADRTPSRVHGEVFAQAFGSRHAGADRPLRDGERDAEDLSLRRRRHHSERRFCRGLHRQLKRYVGVAGVHSRGPRIRLLRPAHHRDAGR